MKRSNNPAGSPALRCFRTPAAQRRARSMTHLAIRAEAKIFFRTAEQMRRRLRTPAQVRRYLADMRRLFVERLGGFPAQRTPLKPRITGRLRRSGYSIEKLVFESRPRFLVAANLYRPAGLAGRAPGILFLNGHADDAKAYREYQRVCIDLALSGFVVLNMDPIGQGERFQFPDPRRFKSALRYCLNEHATLSWRAELLGHTLGAFMIWDGIRGLDYLSSRPEVDPQRLGITGCSGGGTQTAFIAAIDRRLKAAIPNCYLTRRAVLFAQEQLLYDPEQVQWGVVRDGFDHAELIGLSAPAATMVQGGLQDLSFHPAGTRWAVARARPLFRLTGAGTERLALFQADVGHGYYRPFREASVRWFSRWLQGRERPFREPRTATLDRKALFASRTGNVIDLGSRTMLDILRDEARTIARARTARWRRHRTPVARAAAMRAAIVRALGFRPAAGPGRATACGVTHWRGFRVARFLVQGDPGIRLPTLVIFPKVGQSGCATVQASEKGKADELRRSSAEILKRLAAGEVVVLTDLRGWGETRQTAPLWSSPTPHWCYLIGHEGFLEQELLQLGDSLTGARTRDLSAVLDFVTRRLRIPATRITLCGRGAAAWSAALLAHFRRPAALVLSDFLASFESVLQADVPRVPPNYVIHGAYRQLDLPEVLDALDDLPVTLRRPLDAIGRPLKSGGRPRRSAGVQCSD